MANLTDLISDVRSRVDEAVSQFWTDTELARYINAGLRDVARRTETLQDIKQYNTVIGQVQYTAPTDMLRIHRVEYVETTSYRIPLEFQPIMSMDDLWFNRTATGIPKWWSFWGFSSPTQSTSQFYIWPAAATVIANGLRVFYYRLPALLVANNDIADIPAGWEDLPALFAEASARRKDNDVRWKEVHDMYELRLSQMVEVTRLWSDQMTFVSDNSNNMGGLPMWLYGGGD